MICGHKDEQHTLRQKLGVPHGNSPQSKNEEMAK